MRRPHAFRLTAAAAGCLAAAHGIFWSVVNPVNIEMVKWPLDAIPDDWTTARDRWEYGHAVRAGLVLAVLAPLPACVSRGPPQEDAGPPQNVEIAVEVDEAKVLLDRCRAIDPNYLSRMAGWRPYADQTRNDHFLGGLSRHGLFP